MSEKLSPASIRDYSSIVKAVVASAIDENGEEVFPVLRKKSVHREFMTANVPEMWELLSATHPWQASIP
jgi:hypothetical protein